MAETIDTTVTTTEPTTDPVTETTPSEGTEPEGKEAKPESKFLQRLVKLLGIGGDDGDGDANPKEDGKADPPPKDGQTYTEADLQARIDAAKAQWQAEQEEQARLAKLSPEERAKAEATKTSDEIAQLKAQLLARDVRDKAITRLSGDGYPVGLADLLPLTSDQDMTAACDKLTEAFDAAVAATVKERLRGKTPEGIGKASNATEAIRNEISESIRGGMSNG